MVTESNNEYETYGSSKLKRYRLHFVQDYQLTYHLEGNSWKRYSNL